MSGQTLAVADQHRSVKHFVMASKQFESAKTRLEQQRLCVLRRIKRKLNEALGQHFTGSDHARAIPTIGAVSLPPAGSQKSLRVAVDLVFTRPMDKIDTALAVALAGVFTKALSQLGMFQVTVNPVEA